MYERCLTEAERIIAVHREVLVPVKTVWQEVSKQSKRQGFELPTMADFTAMLEADRRFDFLPGGKNDLEHNPLSLDQENAEAHELEKLGFFGDDKVRLKKLGPSDEYHDIPEDDSAHVEDSEIPVSNRLSAARFPLKNLRKKSQAHGATKRRASVSPLKKHR